MSEVQVTVVGMVCGEVRFSRTEHGIPATRFQVRSMPRRFDSKRSAWSDGEPSYYSATCWRQLADNAVASLRPGDPVVLTGRLTIGRWKKDEDWRVSASIDVQAIGHDLRWGSSTYMRGGARAVTVLGAVGGEGAETAVRAVLADGDGKGNGDAGAVGGAGEGALAAACVGGAG